jgi:hypothetical protein
MEISKYFLIKGNFFGNVPVPNELPFVRISPFHRAFQFTMCNGPTNALVCNKTLIQMSHIKTFKTLKITPTCFDHQLIIIMSRHASPHKTT